MKKIHLYTWPTCPYCIKARKLLNDNGYEFEDTDIAPTPEVKEDLYKKTGQRTVPFVFVGDTLLGGASDLDAALRDGSFAELVK